MRDIIAPSITIAVAMAIAAAITVTRVWFAGSITGGSVEPAIVIAADIGLAFTKKES